jgi:hypothetical protein
MPLLPSARGPLSQSIVEGLRRAPGSGLALPRVDDDPLGGDDLHLALYVLYELSYRSFDDVDDDWERDPAVAAARASLEDAFTDTLVDTVGRFTAPDDPSDVSRALVDLSEAGGPPLSRYLAREANLEQFREFVMHRSAYTLKEADPHTFAMPRIAGRAKAALVEIQADEYGGGRYERMHSTIFAATMRALGLDDTYGAYLDRLPGTTLATVNLVSMFGLHRRWRGAAVGHLALFELTSAVPNRRYGNGLRRLGFDQAATRYYDEHVEADSVHDMIAAYDLAGSLVTDHPELAHDVLFGAESLFVLEQRFAAGLLESWNAGRSSLLPEPSLPHAVGQ